MVYKKNKRALGTVPILGLTIVLLVVFSSLIFLYQDDIRDIKFERTVKNPDAFLNSFHRA